jgi:hypothetical protein
MPERRRLHPERVLMVLIAAFGVPTYALFATGYFFGMSNLYRWAWITGAITVLLGCTPMVVFLIGLVIEKLWGNRHD